MKKAFLPLLFAVLAMATACKKETPANAGDARAAVESSAEADSYSVNTSTSVIEWTGSKQVAEHSGTLKLSDGTIFVKNGKVEGGMFTIDMNSITVVDLKPGDGKEDLEEHLKGTKVEKADHFFNVEKYPTAKFEITGITSETGKSIIEGNLTIKETTKNVKFPAIVNVSENSVSITSDRFIIDRTLWKVNYASKSVFTDLTDKFVNDEVELKVSVNASK